MAETGMNEGKPAEFDPRFKLFKFNLNTVRHIEEMTGKPFEGVDLRFGGQMQIMLWAGLVDEWPEKPAPTFEQIGRMITTENNKLVLNFMLDVLNASSPKNKEAKSDAMQGEGQEKKEVT